MIAPNKVYILPSQYNLQYDNGGEEYIRKDALLEWAERQLATCDGAVAMQRAYDKLIDKIKSL